MHLVDLFTQRWGVSAARTGVCVWFELGLEAVPESPEGPGETEGPRWGRRHGEQGRQDGIDARAARGSGDR